MSSIFDEAVDNHGKTVGSMADAFFKWAWMSGPGIITCIWCPSLTGCYTCNGFKYGVNRGCPNCGAHVDKSLEAVACLGREIYICRSCGCVALPCVSGSSQIQAAYLPLENTSKDDTI